MYDASGIPLRVHRRTWRELEESAEGDAASELGLVHTSRRRHVAVC